MDIIIKHIKELIDALFTENKATPYKTSYGSEIQPFGVGKLKVIELISNLAKMKNEEIYKYFDEINFYKKLFVSYILMIIS